MSGRYINWRAVEWVLYEAGDVPPQLRYTLLIIAAHTSNDGTGAYPSDSTLALLTGKSERQSLRDRLALEKQGLIRRGDQKLAAHLPANRRPVVFDLLWGVTDVTPGRFRGDKSGHQGRHRRRPGVTPMSDKEVHKTSRNGAHRDRAGSADASTPENPHHPPYSAPPCPECGKPFSQEQLADPEFRASALAGEVIHGECIEREPGS